MAPRPIRVLSLFTGAGGLDLAIGLALPDARPVCYVEVEINAARILAARFADGSLPEAPVWSDVRAFDGRRWRGAVDLVVGGFPCTDLSVAGKQAGLTGEHSGLWFEYLRIVREIHPRGVFIENVPPVLTFPSGSTVLRGLAESGFNAEWLSLRASDVGAPHRRERAFILAYSRCELGDIQQRSVWSEYSGDSGALANAALRGFGVRGKSSRNDGQPDRYCTRVGDSHIAEVVPDAAITRLAQWRGERSDDGGERPPAERDSLPLFPPGPADADAWKNTIARWPWLAPATQPGVHGAVDGVAVVVDASRTDSLRAIGNGVVAVQGAAAFIELSRRAGIDWEGADV